MATLTIKDLPANRALSRHAQSAMRGGSAGWIYGWIRAYVERTASGIAPVINFFQTNNFYVADQMNNQIVEISVQNSGNNSSINVAPNQIGVNRIA